MRSLLSSIASTLRRVFALHCIMCGYQAGETDDCPSCEYERSLKLPQTAIHLPAELAYNPLIHPLNSLPLPLPASPHLK